MAITLKTAKMLWGRAAGRCSMTGCRIVLVLDETETDDEALIGEMCHMVAEAEDGPRGRSPLAAEKRNLYDNLVLLCRNHHGEIDGQEQTYSTELLQKIKADHEAWVRTSLPGYNSAKQRDDELYAGYVDEWARRCNLAEWTIWSGWLLSCVQPSMLAQVDEQLFELRRWMLVRIWPGRYPTLERALQNFADVLSDFQCVFRKHAMRPHPNADQIQTEIFYKIREWNEERYERLARQYKYHVELVEDLILELTRAANLVCDEIRKKLLPSFRLKDGKLSVVFGDGLKWCEMVVEYGQGERSEAQPYPGLTKFLTARVDRDWHFGQGNPPS